MIITTTMTMTRMMMMRRRRRRMMMMMTKRSRRKLLTDSRHSFRSIVRGSINSPEALGLAASSIDRTKEDSPIFPSSKCRQCKVTLLLLPSFPSSVHLAPLPSSVHLSPFPSPLLPLSPPLLPSLMLPRRCNRHHGEPGGHLGELRGDHERPRQQRRGVP